ncbi:MAG: cell division protein FtsX [Pseudochelatococcus sp.]|jgi:cell division transport system permease protein|uniref:cell division protein FtsX n=1 Tax=Pseudochelatococcus sp. TaxID=2020869 RepID=UPI003D8A3E38
MSDSVSSFADDAPDAAIVTPAQGEDRLPDNLSRNLPLVPPDSTSGRALVTVVAILTFLAALAAGIAQLVTTASQNWTSTIAREATIQIKPDARRNADEDVLQAAEIARAYPSIAGVEAQSREEAERLLEPWLGKGADFAELPVPRLVVLRLREGSETTATDLAELRQQLTDTIPGATLDDHRNWIERLAVMARTVVLVATLIVALVVVAAALAIATTTRGAVAGDREILDVLHFVGADDRFIVGEYRSRFFHMGLRGGLLGSISAVFVLAGAGVMSAWWRASPGGDQLQALFGAFNMDWKGYATIFAVAAVVAIVTAAVSGFTVRRYLTRLQ